MYYDPKKIDVKQINIITHQRPKIDNKHHQQKENKVHIARNKGIQQVEPSSMSAVDSTAAGNESTAGYSQVKPVLIELPTSTARNEYAMPEGSGANRVGGLTRTDPQV